MKNQKPRTPLWRTGLLEFAFASSATPQNRVAYPCDFCKGGAGTTHPVFSVYFLFQYNVDSTLTLTMTLDNFLKSLTDPQPPPGLSLALTGLWYDAKSDWARAHEFAQQDEGPAGSWVHAYLHRKEGDQSNASYWYNRVKRPVCRDSLDTEWQTITKSLLT